MVIKPSEDNQVILEMSGSIAVAHSDMTPRIITLTVRGVRFEKHYDNPHDACHEYEDLKKVLKLKNAKLRTHRRSVGIL